MIYIINNKDNLFFIIRSKCALNMFISLIIYAVINFRYCRPYQKYGRQYLKFLTRKNYILLIIPKLDLPTMSP